MRWPWIPLRPDDHAAAERGCQLEIKTRAAEDRAVRIIAEAQRAKARSLWHVRENHLGPDADLALKESR